MVFDIAVFLKHVFFACSLFETTAVPVDFVRHVERSKARHIALSFVVHLPLHCQLPSVDARAGTYWTSLWQLSTCIVFILT